MEQDLANYDSSTATVFDTKADSVFDKVFDKVFDHIFSKDPQTASGSEKAFVWIAVVLGILSLLFIGAVFISLLVIFIKFTWSWLKLKLQQARDALANQMERERLNRDHEVRMAEVNHRQDRRMRFLHLLESQEAAVPPNESQPQSQLPLYVSPWFAERFREIIDVIVNGTSGSADLERGEGIVRVVPAPNIPVVENGQVHADDQNPQQQPPPLPAPANADVGDGPEGGRPARPNARDEN